MKYLTFFIVLGAICLSMALVSVQIASAISLDDLDDLDRQDVGDYIDKARKAADRENFSAADDYLKRAAKYGIEKRRIKNARDYVSKKRQERAARLEAQRKAEEERRAAAARARRQSSGSSSGSSSSGRCSRNASLFFESSGETFTGTCTGSRNIQITSRPDRVSVDTSKDNFVFVADYIQGCIRGNYSFTYTAKAGMACDKRVGYSGSFYLDGMHDSYTITLSGDMISVYGY